METSTKAFRPVKLIVAISGASGSIYARRFIQLLGAYPGESSLIITDAALEVCRQEERADVKSDFEYLRWVSADPAGKRDLQHRFHLEKISNIGGLPASGSVEYDGMIVIPCSIKTLSAISDGRSSTLLERAADVTLKERRPLVVVVREAPYNLIHLRKMTALTEAGGIVLPASPPFYHKPESIEQLVDAIVYRSFSLLRVPMNSPVEWRGA